ncbi:MAG: type II toxin-antitoxin system RelE/ParE family toxin, partial [Betaproteobacteria bacterium]|nr:type II toxin-antitoxin system RelE/ParE family toxin [Betaproteobacteria bacterium]
MFELIHYCDADGRDMFARWLDSISDMQARARVAARLV